MKRHQKLVSWLLVFSMLIMMCACNSTSGKREKRSEESKPEHKGRQTETTETTEPTPTDTPTPTGIPKEYNDDEIIDLTMFSFENVSKPNDGNDIQKLIARKTGVRLQEKGMKDYSGTEEEIISQMESTQSVPDFVDLTRSSMRRGYWSPGMNILINILISRRCIQMRNGKDSENVTARSIG